MPITDWDDAYANAAYIPDAERFLSEWPVRTDTLRAAVPPIALRYRPGLRQVI